jgi:hypothetical protein
MMNFEVNEKILPLLTKAMGHIIPQALDLSILDTSDVGLEKYH